MRALIAAALVAALAAPALADDGAPTNIRIERLRHEVDVLKARAELAKMQAAELQAKLLGGGLGATVTIVHENDMSGSFRLVELTYALDGTQIAHQDGANLWKTHELNILSQPIAPGGHTLTVVAVYRGHGYGVFDYLDSYTFTVRSSHDFTAPDGQATTLTVDAMEKSATEPMADRPTVRFDVSSGQ